MLNGKRHCVLQHSLGSDMCTAECKQTSVLLLLCWWWAGEAKAELEKISHSTTIGFYTRLTLFWKVIQWKCYQLDSSVLKIHFFFLLLCWQGSFTVFPQELWELSWLLSHHACHPVRWIRGGADGHDREGVQLTLLSQWGLDSQAVVLLSSANAVQQFTVDVFT